MKKLNIFAASLIALGLFSCDMDKYPYDALEETTYMATMNDFANARVGLYSAYRSLTTGGYILTSEIQGDDFNAVSGFSNSYGNAYRWDFQSTDGNIEAIWSAYYAHIARANYYIDSYNKIVEAETTTFTEEEIATLGAYTAEAYFTRANAYLTLAGYFCKGYDAATAETDLGLPLQLTYAPSSDASTYPGRSSMKATYAQIMSDIADAERLINPSLILTKDQNALNYISADVVTALKARAALQMKDYATAVTASTSLIASGDYPLIDVNTQAGVNAFYDLWEFDEGTEVMWQIYLSPDELGSATGTTFWGQYKESDQSQQIMDYIPTQSLVNLYDVNDIRLSVYFAPFTLTVATGAQGDIYVFNKYPGNPELNASLNVDDHYTNYPKPFRISEQYLIAAEAYAGSKNLSKAGEYLNALKSKRILGYDAKPYNNEVTFMTALQDERHRELVGEGFRLVDLKRWGIGVNRGNAPQNANLVLYPGAETTTALNKAANDFRMVWPIPKSEMDANPQLKGQQNPGY